MYEELVKRLRDYAASRKGEIAELTAGAADSIEELSKRVPKTPHGRLIDADAFERRCMFDGDIEDMQDVIYALRDYQTVIPAEEGE